jgi:hypothetical protein
MHTEASSKLVLSREVVHSNGKTFPFANPKIFASKTGLGLNPEALNEVIGCLIFAGGVAKFCVPHKYAPPRLPEVLSISRPSDP